MLEKIKNNQKLNHWKAYALINDSVHRKIMDSSSPIVLEISLESWGFSEERWRSNGYEQKLVAYDIISWSFWWIE